MLVRLANIFMALVSSRRSRNFHFTYYPPDDHNRLEIRLDMRFSRVQGLCRGVGQWETCPETGRLHFQGLAVFNCKLVARTAKNRIQAGFEGAHVEPERPSDEGGGLLRSYRYVTKITTRRFPDVEPHHWPEAWSPREGQGSRTDLHEAKATLEEHGIGGLIENHLEVFLRYQNGWNTIQERLMRERSRAWRPVKVLVLWGPSRTGKTRLAFDASSDLFRLPCTFTNGVVWWCGYEGEDVVLLDDFYGNIPFSYMLNVLDGHQLRLGVKKTHTYALYNYVIITSNVHPSEWYNDTRIPRSAYDAFHKRITKIIHVDTDLVYTMLKENKIEDYF